MHVDHVGLGIEVIIPDILQKHGAGDDVAGIAHQIFKELELAGLQENGLASAGDRSRQKIHLKVEHAEASLLRLGGAAAGEPLDASQKLRERIRFRQIIISTGAKSLHLLVDIAESTQNQNRRLNAL